MTEKNNKKDCIFCKIITGEIKSEKLYEDDNLLVINDAHPVSEGHCLILTKKHYETLLDVPSTMGAEIFNLAKRQCLRLIKEKRAEGITLSQNNFGAAGQTVRHYHLHVIPRKSQDGVRL